MRQQLNENPRVQLIVLAVVGIIAAVLVFSTVMKKDPATDPAAVPPAATDTAATDTGATAPIDSSTESGAPATTDPAATAPDPAATTPVAPSGAPGDAGAADGLLPSKGLPKDVLVAYAKNKVIALLVYDPEGLSDRGLEAFTKPLQSRDDVEVFEVKSKDIGDYSRITAGLSVSRVPALIVIRPRNLNDGAPTATVSYGFRSPKSVDQAVRDALYDGKAVTAYP